MLKDWKQKTHKKLRKPFHSWLEEEIDQKIWVDKGTEFAGAFKKFCTAEGIKVYNEWD